MKFELTNYEILPEIQTKLIEISNVLKYTEPIRFFAAVHLWQHCQYLVHRMRQVGKGRPLFEGLV